MVINEKCCSSVCKRVYYDVKCNLSKWSDGVNIRDVDKNKIINTFSEFIESDVRYEDGATVNDNSHVELFSSNGQGSLDFYPYSNIDNGPYSVILNINNKRVIIKVARTPHESHIIYQDKCEKFALSPVDGYIDLNEPTQEKRSSGNVAKDDSSKPRLEQFVIEHDVSYPHSMWKKIDRVVAYPGNLIARHISGILVFFVVVAMLIILGIGIKKLIDLWTDSGLVAAILGSTLGALLYLLLAMIEGDCWCNISDGCRYNSSISYFQFNHNNIIHRFVSGCLVLYLLV